MNLRSLLKKATPSASDTDKAAPKPKVARKPRSKGESEAKGEGKARAKPEGKARTRAEGKASRAEGKSGAKTEGKTGTPAGGKSGARRTAKGEAEPGTQADARPRPRKKVKSAEGNKPDQAADPDKPRKRVKKTKPAAEAADTPASPPARKPRRLRKLILGSMLLGLLYLLYPLPSVLWMRWRDPATTAFMEIYRDKAGPKGRFEHKFVPLEKIAPILAEAVMVAEDDGFYDHPGVELRQLQKSFETNLKQGKFVRGGSTITMQLAKNLYLSPSRSLIRKGRELIITGMLELCLSKQRILELYLNLIEWGPGIYGAEAASRRYFGKSASALNATQAATLAAAISAPSKSNPASPSARLLRKRDLLLERMRRKGVLR